MLKRPKNVGRISDSEDSCEKAPDLKIAKNEFQKSLVIGSKEYRMQRSGTTYVDVGRCKGFL